MSQTHIRREATCYVPPGSVLVLTLISQSRPQVLLRFQNGERRNPWTRLLKYSKNRRVFCWWHKRHFQRLFLAIGGRVCFLTIWNRCLNKTKTFHHDLAGQCRGFSARHFESWGRAWQCLKMIPFLLSIPPFRVDTAEITLSLQSDQKWWHSR